MRKYQVIHGNSLEVLDLYPDNSIDCIVCDPPYGISFMGKDWDKALPPVEIWEKCFKKLKPGGYILAMSATRTYHRLAVQLEDLGFIVHPMIGWLFGSGFPKATDLGKQFDKQAKAKRKVVGKSKNGAGNKKNETLFSDDNFEWQKEIELTAPATKLAKKWDGWKYGLQSLKPALEPIFMGQKPHLKPMTENIKKYGVGAVNVDACRVKGLDKPTAGKRTKTFGSNNEPISGGEKDINFEANKLGRFPANVIHDGSDEVINEFPNSVGQGHSPKTKITGMGSNYGGKTEYNGVGEKFTDSGSAARFFYTAKPSKKERDAGLESLENAEKYKAGNYSQSPVCKTCEKTLNGKNDHSNCSGEVYYRDPKNPSKNNHPTVKPVKLMEYLIKLVCPKGGTVLDPFCGSGTTGVAAKKLKVNFIGIELNEEYVKIAKARIKAAK